MYTTTSIDNTGVPTSLLNVFQVNGGTSSGIFFTFHGLYKSSQLFSGRLNVDGELVVLVDLELNRVPDLQKLLLVGQTSDAELVLGQDWKKDEDRASGTLFPYLKLSRAIYGAPIH